MTHAGRDLEPRQAAGPAVRGGLAFAAAIALLVLTGSRGTIKAGETWAGGGVTAAARAGSATGETTAAGEYPANEAAVATSARPSAPSANSRAVSTGAPAPASADVETGRVILTHHCGTCHMPGLPTSSAKALAIFSLADADWSAHMTDAQICASGRRIKGTARRDPAEALAYVEVVGRLLKQRGAPPCGS